MGITNRILILNNYIATKLSAKKKPIKKELYDVQNNKEMNIFEIIKDIEQTS